MSLGRWCFFFADQESLDVLKGKSKGAYVMTCGNTECIRLSHFEGYRDTWGLKYARNGVPQGPNHRGVTPRKLPAQLDLSIANTAPQASSSQYSQRQQGKDNTYITKGPGPPTLPGTKGKGFPSHGKGPPPQRGKAVPPYGKGPPGKAPPGKGPPGKGKGVPPGKGPPLKGKPPPKASR